MDTLPQGELRFVRQDADGRSVLAVAGEIDMVTAPSLRARIEELIESGSADLILDLSGIDFLDSSGLGVMVSALKSVKGAGGSLAVVAQEPRVVKVFDISGIGALIRVHPSLTEALSAQT